MEMEMLDNPLFSMDAKELLEFLESGKGITLEELQQAYQEQRQLEEDGYLYSLLSWLISWVVLLQPRKKLKILVKSLISNLDVKSYLENLMSSKGCEVIALGN